MELFRRGDVELPQASCFSLQGDEVALANRTLVQVLTLGRQPRVSVASSEAVRQVFLTTTALYVLTSVLRVYKRPDCANPWIVPHSESASSFAVCEPHIAIVRGERVILLTQADPSSVQELSAPFAPRLALPTDAPVVLLQADFEVSLIRHTGVEVKRVALTSKVIRLFMDRLPDSVLVPHLKGFLVTRDQETRVLGFDGKDVDSVKAIGWKDRPAQVAFLFPGYIVGVMKDGEMDIAMLATGAHLCSLAGLKSPLQLSAASNTLLQYDQKAWVLLTGPTPDSVVSYLLRRGDYSTALAVNEHINGAFAAKIYLEQGLYYFQVSREYSKAVHCFHKSGRYWVPCLFFKHSVKLEKNVKAYCEPFFQEARSELRLTNLHESTQALLAEDRTIFDDNDAMRRAQKEFYPYFQSLRELRNETQRFAEVWLFHTALLFPELTERLTELLTTDNLLPSKHCEKVLQRQGKFDLLYKLFLSKKVHGPALALMKARYEETKERKWLHDLWTFLCRMQKDEDAFVSYLTFLFETDYSMTSSLLMREKPVILRKVDLSRKLLPMLRALGGNSIAIDLLSSAPDASADQHNELAELLVQEVSEGRMHPASLTEYLAKEPFLYDPRVVLKLLPAAFQTERCILLDKLKKYDEVSFTQIFHYYLAGGNLRKALDYVNEKKNPEVTNALIYQLEKEGDTKTLLQLLTADSAVFDHEFVRPMQTLEMLPRNLPLTSLKKYLTNTFEALERQIFTVSLKRHTAEQQYVQLFTEYFEEASTQCVDLTEDSRCCECGRLISTCEFLLTESRKVVHLDCYVPELL